MAKKKQLKSKKKRAKKVTIKPIWQQTSFLVGVAIIVLTTIFFIPSLDNHFVNWDDEVNLLENPYMAAFDWYNIKGIFTSTVIGNYNPLPIFTLAIENAIFGMEDAFIYHLDNLILHLVCVFFVYRIGFLLGLNIWGSALLALLFGFHPMRVESVAWVTERKDVLFGVFYLAAIYNYLKYLAGGLKEKRLFYWTLGLFFISLFAKIQAVALPLTMLAADYYFGRPLKFKLILEKWLFFGLSLVIGLLGIYFLQQQGSVGGEDPTNYTFFQRILVGFFSYVVYLVKFIYPYEMSTLYPYPRTLGWPFYVAPFIIIALFIGLFLAYKKERKALVFGFAFFTFNVMFLLQVLGAGQGYLADRFTYMPYFGLFFIAAWYFQWLLKHRPAWKLPILGGVGAYLLLFGLMTWKQNDVWQNGETLWTQAIKVNDKNSNVWNFRGNYYRENGQLELALSDYGQAIRMNSRDAKLYNSRGKAFFNLARYGEALNDYNQAVTLESDNAEFFSNRGAALGALKRYDEALADLAHSIELDNETEGAYKNRLVLLYELGRFQEALPDHDAFLRIKPYDADIWYSKGLTYRQLGDEQSALGALNEAVRLNPNQPSFVFERAKVNSNLGNKTQALQDAQRARQLGMQIDEAMMQRFR